MSRTTRYANVVSGSHRGSLELTDSHLQFSYEVEEESNQGWAEKETRTIKLPWSKVSHHEISSDAEHILTVITGNNNSSKAFEFADRGSLLKIQKDIQARLATITSADAPNGQASPISDQKATTNGDYPSQVAKADQDSSTNQNLQTDVSSNRLQAASLALDSSRGLDWSESDREAKRRPEASYSPSTMQPDSGSHCQKDPSSHGSDHVIRNDDPDHARREPTTTAKDSVNVIPKHPKPTKISNAWRQRSMDGDPIDEDIRAKIAAKASATSPLDTSIDGDPSGDDDVKAKMAAANPTPKGAPKPCAISSASRLASTNTESSFDIMAVVKERQLENQNNNNDNQRTESSILEDLEAAQPEAHPEPLHNPSRPPISQPGAVAITPAASLRNANIVLNQSTSFDLEDEDPSADILVQATLVESNRAMMTSSQIGLLEEETRERVMNELVVDAGPAIPVDETDKQKCRRFGWVALAVAIVVGAVVGATAKTLDRDPSIETILLTVAPTISSQPTWSPSEYPTTTPSPSHVPTETPTTNPSYAPTREPDNRFCTDAQELWVGDRVVEETLSRGPVMDDDIRVDTEVTTCHASRNNTFSTPAAKWYRVKGVGPLTVTACSNQTSTMNTGIQVYMGSSNACQQALECVTNLNYNTPTLSSDCTAVSWMSLPDSEYLVLVSQEVPTELSNNISDADVAIRLVNNDYCARAYRPMTPPWPKTNLFGSFDNATSDQKLAPACGDATVPQKAGVWYEITGINGTIAANTCGQTAADVDTQISVYKGNCGELECVDGNDWACGESGFQSFVSWNSVRGENYYILVHTGGGTTSGSFSLTIQSLEVPHDKCSNAEVLVPGAGDLVVNVPLDAATEDPEIVKTYFDCLVLFYPEDIYDTSRGLWYSIAGTGATYEVEVSGGAGPYAIVYEGNCDNLDCNPSGLVSVNSLGTGMTWESEEGKNYLVYVFYHLYSQSGDVQLVLREAT